MVAFFNPPDLIEDVIQGYSTQVIVICLLRLISTYFASCNILLVQMAEDRYYLFTYVESRQNDIYLILYLSTSALRSGDILTNDRIERWNYCQLKTIPNTPPRGGEIPSSTAISVGLLRRQYHLFDVNIVHMMEDQGLSIKKNSRVRTHLFRCRHMALNTFSRFSVEQASNLSVK